MKGKAFFFSLFFAAALSAVAAPPNTVVLDGRMGEYDEVDHRAAYTGGGGGFGAGNRLDDLYVTWDDTYLYVGLAGAEVDNKLVVMLDVDPGNGTGAQTTTNWLTAPDYIRFNDVGWQAQTVAAPDFGLDYMFASEGFYNNALRILYDGVAAPDTNTVIALFDAGNGATPQGTPVDMAAYGDDTLCTLKGFETRIPWSEVYGANTGRFGTVNGGEVVPQGAVIRLFANLHNNTPAVPYSSDDAIPQQTLGAYAGGLLTSDTYIDVTIDGDNDGFPDVAGGDVNAPWIRYASGATGHRQLFVQLSEPVQDVAASDVTNWLVGVDQPGSVTLLSTNTLVLNLTNDLPAAGTLVLVSATNVADGTGNQRLTEYCLLPAASGLTNTLTVRFVLESSSGLGASPGASNFFVNGSSYPLEFGYPPATSSPLAVLSGSLRYRDVVFPPGTPATLSYKYSGQLNNTGTNNYEAVRLTGYDSASRVLTLDPEVASMTVTDHLGAAAGPWRDPATNTFYSALYADSRRGDAGVREKVNLFFALNLSQRNPAAIQRVMVQGSDPLRGFNLDGTLPVGVSDYAGGGAVGWTQGGIELVDDGTLGDLVADDGIYSRTWAATPDGNDMGLVLDFPGSLVGGDYSTPPFYVDNWVGGRSPRSFKYKFYVLKTDNSVVEAPASDLEVYLEDGLGTNRTFAFLWDNEGLPLAPPTNSPGMLKPVLVASNQVRVLFENVTNELQHGVLISTNLNQGWMDFGKRAAGAGGSWTALVSDVNAGGEYYAAFAGAAVPFRGVYIEGLPLPGTGGALRIWYNQHSRGLAGSRQVNLAGSFNGWSGQPMTFAGDGSWYRDVLVTAAGPGTVEFKPNFGGTWEGFQGGGNNYVTYTGDGRATWTPANPTNGGLFTIVYDASTGPIIGATNVSAWVGYDEGYVGSTAWPMTNAGGALWTTTGTVSTNYTLSVNFVFNGQTNGSAAVIWDNESIGRLHRAFISPRPYGVTP